MGAEECWEPLAAGGGKDGFSPPPSKGAQPSQRCACYSSFPGGSVAKNPPANAGDTGSIPDIGGPHAEEQLSSCITPTEPGLWRPPSQDY